MGIADDLGSLADVPAVAAPPWTPGVDLDSDGSGEVRTRAFVGDVSPEWDDILAAFSLSPQEFAIVDGTVRVSVWDAQVKGGKVIQMRAYRARVVRRRAHTDVDVDVLVKQISRHRKRRTKVPTGTSSLVVVLGDFQIGKPDGDGTKGTVDRILAAIDALTAHVKALRKAGHGIGSLHVLSTGDLFEGFGHYATQNYGLELDRREQTRVVRRLLVKALTTWAPLFESVTVTAVAGNHGEHRNGDGKAFTTMQDNDDLAVWEQVAEIVGANDEAFGHVSFGIGGDPLLRVVDVSGARVAVTHGHMARSGGDSGVESRLQRYYQAQVAGQRIAPVDVLVTGHYHHLRVAQWGPTMWLQCPAMDGGSDWYASTKGDESPAGMLTFTLGGDRRPNHLTIL